MDQMAAAGMQPARLGCCHVAAAARRPVLPLRPTLVLAPSSATALQQARPLNYTGEGVSILRETMWQQVRCCAPSSTSSCARANAWCFLLKPGPAPSLRQLHILLSTPSEPGSLRQP